jgi:hypothetical protein
MIARLLALKLSSRTIRPTNVPGRSDLDGEAATLARFADQHDGARRTFDEIARLTGAARAV